jgi:hypothetical protein
VIKPIPLRRPIPGGFTRDNFVIDHHARTATCPAGHTVAITAAGSADFRARCTACPLRPRRTRATRGRHLTIAAHDDELVYGRAAWHDPILQDHYRRHRPIVERTIAWLVARGHRKVRYRGVARNRIWLTHRAAVNHQRLINLGLHHHGRWQLAT